MKFRALFALVSLLVLPQASLAGAGLPTCVNDQATLQTIIRIQKANKNNNAKYDGYREFLKDDGAALLARLAYAETLAAECPTLNYEILPGIVDVIANRAAMRQDNVKSVVYQRDQFASSLNIYKKSRYLDFLCPKDAKLWAAALETAEKSLYNGAAVLPRNAFNYYFYLHDPKWPVPEWANYKKHQPVKTPNFNKIQKCIRYFNHLKFN
ncbi:MAG: hypothetical protein AABZ31_15115 [Bdellovibrionota bacterium]